MASIVPTDAAQLTPAVSLVVAVNCVVCPVPTAVDCGLTDTVIAAAVGESIDDEDPPPHPTAKSVKGNSTNPTKRPKPFLFISRPSIGEFLRGSDSWHRSKTHA